MSSLFVAGTASAQSTTSASFPVERLRPAFDRDGIIDVESGYIMPRSSFDAALWLGYANDPLVLYRDENGTNERAATVVAHRVGASFVGALPLLDWLSLGVDLPVTLYQGAGNLDEIGGNVDVKAVGVGDIRVAAKARLLSRLRYGVDLALVPAVSVPSGVPKSSYFGDRNMTLAPGLALSTVAHDLRLALNLGYRWRQQSTLLDLDVGPELEYRAGAALRLDALISAPVEVAASVSGSAAAAQPFSRFNQSPLELLLSGAYDATSAIQAFAGMGMGVIAGYATPDLRVFAGVRYAPRESDRDRDRLLDEVDRCPDEPEDYDSYEDGDGCIDADNDKDRIKDVNDKCPMEAEDKDKFHDDDGCPDLDNDDDRVPDEKDKCPVVAEDRDDFQDEDGCVDEDNDKDAIKDVDDKCPLEAEDKDKFEDENGCPDPDNDRDGVLDGADKCPEKAEVVNGVDDEDGCPDEGKAKVQVTATKIEITEKVYFETAKAVIQSRSFNLLQQVASILKANAQITKVRIEGHTDSQGDDASNLKLSQARADAVLAFLQKRGVNEAILEAVGFGETRPIASNKSSKGREANRRVEFMIAEIDGKPVATAATK